VHRHDHLLAQRDGGEDLLARALQRRVYVPLLVLLVMLPLPLLPPLLPLLLLLFLPPPLRLTHAAQVTTSPRS